MRNILVKIDTGFVSCVHEFEFDVDDDTTEQEINEMVKDAVFNYIDVSWEEVK